MSPLINFSQRTIIVGAHEASNSNEKNWFTFNLSCQKQRISCSPLLKFVIYFVVNENKQRVDFSSCLCRNIENCQKSSAECLRPPLIYFAHQLRCNSSASGNCNQHCIPSNFGHNPHSYLCSCPENIHSAPVCGLVGDKASVAKLIRTEHAHIFFRSKSIFLNFKRANPFVSSSLCRILIYSWHDYWKCVPTECLRSMVQLLELHFWPEKIVNVRYKCARFCT